MKTTDQPQNPFAGKRALLALFNQAYKVDVSSPSGKSTLISLLTNAYGEVKTEDEKSLFYTIVFYLGDVSNREHNMLTRRFASGKIDQGGLGLRQHFLIASEWMLNFNAETNAQWHTFIPIIGEYTNLENIFYGQQRTDRFKGKLISEIKLNVNMEVVASHLARLISNQNTPDVVHTLLAKFIDIPRFNKRSTKIVVNEKNIAHLKKRTGNAQLTIGSTLTFKRKSKLKSTEDLVARKTELATILSEKLGWEVIKYEHNVAFPGLREYKAKYNRRTEAYLFSSKEILEFDQDQFTAWLNGLSSEARYRVQRRLFEADEKKNLKSTKKWVGKYGDLANFYNAWLKSKEVAVATLKELTPDKKQNMTVKEIQAIEKAAKVNVGADKLIDQVVALFKRASSEAELNLKAGQLLDQITMKVPVFPIVDISGSMSSLSVYYNDVSFSAQQMAALATTTFLLKNPDESLGSTFIRFDDKAEIILDGASVELGKTNRFMQAENATVKKVVDKTKSFLENFKSVQSYCLARNGTNFTSVVTFLDQWVNKVNDEGIKAARIETINSYPVWLVISDGDMNQSYSAAASVKQFMDLMNVKFGWNGVLVIWDVKGLESAKSNKFEGIDNVMYYSGFNQSTLNMVFKNIHNLDAIDVYTPLLALARSNRYEPVRELVSKRKKAKIQQEELV